MVNIDELGGCMLRDACIVLAELGSVYIDVVPRLGCWSRESLVGGEMGFIYHDNYGLVKGCGGGGKGWM